MRRALLLASAIFLPSLLNAGPIGPGQIVTTVSAGTGIAVSTTAPFAYVVSNTGGVGSVFGAVIVSTVALTGVHADISPTTLYTPTGSGNYMISAYILSSAGDGGDTQSTFGFNWTDSFGNQNSSGVGGSLAIPTSAGNAGQSTIQIDAVSGQPIQYSFSGGTYASAVYSIYIAVVQLTSIGGGGGSGSTSTLAVFVNGVEVSSPTSSLGINGSGVSYTNSGSSTTIVITGTGGSGGGYAVQPATVTFILPLGVLASTVTASTITVSGEIVLEDGTVITSTHPFDYSSSIASLGISTGSLQTQINSVGLATGTLKTQIDAVAISTGVLSVSTTSLQSQISGLGTTYLTNSSATATYLQQSSATATYLTKSSATATYFNPSGILPVASGGTGTATPGLVAGTNITSITGTWPNQTINASTQTSGGSTLSVATGSVSGFTSSNTVTVLNLDASQFSSTLQTSATAFITITLATNTVTGNYAATSTDTVILANCSSNCTITLPTAVGIKGKIYHVKMLNDGAVAQVTIGTTSSQTIDGLTTFVIYNKYTNIELLSDNANWNIL